MEKDRTRDIGTMVLGFLTLVAFVAAAVMLGGADLFRKDGRWLTLEELDHVGSWLGGLFAPTALAWTARAFFLQRQQLNEELARARDDRENDEREAHATLLRENPVLSCESSVNYGNNGFADSVDIKITNVASPAVEITAVIEVLDAWEQHLNNDEAPAALHTSHVFGALMTGGFKVINLPVSRFEIDPVNVIVTLSLYAVRRDGRIWHTESRSSQGRPFRTTRETFVGDIHL